MMKIERLFPLIEYLFPYLLYQSPTSPLKPLCCQENHPSFSTELKPLVFWCHASKQKQKTLEVLICPGYTWSYEWHSAGDGRTEPRGCHGLARRTHSTDRSGSRRNHGDIQFRAFTSHDGPTSRTCGGTHPSPTEYLEVLTELQRVEARLQPFVQRYQEILSTATTADYNNNVVQLWSLTEGREEDQRIINLVGEALRFLGNTFVALSDLRCNLAANTPRHLHVVRPMSHYASPVVLQQAVPIQRRLKYEQGIRFDLTERHVSKLLLLLVAVFGALDSAVQINVGTTVTMTTNGSRTQHMAEGQATVPPTANATPAVQPQGTDSREAPETQGSQAQTQTPHPRVIRITHQTMEPVVMMQMNLQGDSAAPGNASATASSATGNSGPVKYYFTNSFVFKSRLTMFTVRYVRKVMEGVTDDISEQHLNSTNLFIIVQFDLHRVHLAAGVMAALLHKWAEELKSMGD
eukprot:g48402.t1